MSYLGSWKIDDLLTFVCVTQVFTTGVATDADSVPTYRVYEDETGTPILTGSMALLDSANTAGFYSEQITLSAANGFEKGKCYSIYIAATVSSVAGAAYRTFQMEAEVDANRVNWANVDNPTTTLNLSGTTIKTATDIATATTAIQADTDDIQTRIPAALTANGNMKSDVLRVNGTVQTAGDIIADTNDIQARLPAALTGDGNIKADALKVGGADPSTTDENADALLDRANAIETGLTPRESLRLASAAVAGKLSGAATTTNTIRNAVADSKDRIVATVDADGNRTAITYDVS